MNRFAIKHPSVLKDAAIEPPALETDRGRGRNRKGPILAVFAASVLVAAIVLGCLAWVMRATGK